MELIVLNIGLDLGLISPTLFAMMVLMALVTTLATTPLLRLLIPSFASHRGKAATAGGNAASHRVPLSASRPRS
jgi:Kef-type K+ transport system membrane component KefB